MRFLSLVKSPENSGPVPQALMDAMQKATEESILAGTLIDSGGLAPTAASTRVRCSGGMVTVMDGPFAETKEVVGGYAVLQVSSREEAVAAAVLIMNLHREHWPEWEGEAEVRQIFGPEDFAPSARASLVSETSPGIGAP